MRQLLPLSLLLAGSARRKLSGGDQGCWQEGIPEDYCCGEEFGSTGNAQCWTPGYSFSKCCGVEAKDRYIPTSRRPVRLSTPCDIVIVGSGSGGATAAATLETAFRVCVVEVTNKEDERWTPEYAVAKNWKWKFGKGIGGLTLVNVGVFEKLSTTSLGRARAAPSYG